MKINYTAIILTALALVGLTIYRLLTPDDYLMILSKPDHQNTCYFAESSDGLHWNMINSSNPVNIPSPGHVSEIKIFKESSHRFNMLFRSEDYLMMTYSDNLINWDNPRLIESHFGSEIDFSEMSNIRGLYQNRERLNIFCLRNNKTDTDVLLFRVTDNKISDQPLEILHSTHRIMDLQCMKFEKINVLALMREDSVSKGMKVDFYQSGITDSNWTHVSDLKTDDENLTETVVLQKSNREFWLYGNQNRIISVKQDRETNLVTSEILAEKSDFSSGYVLKSGLKIRRDMMKKLKEQLKSPKL
ncbi:hypothetical protein ACE1ET_13095 [Saccharicrinis sp. FJH62]|uniref:hypothetical protein n=1 Tax=Saccharicrinis sp. FJH62 TaxID=3344657 RepID=UPI0035D46354